MSFPCYIIAEAGVNHNGSIELAMEMVHAAARSGADAIKFQTFTADNLVSKNARKANYQKLSTSQMESQYDMLKRLQLDDNAYEALLNQCHKKAIDFLSSPFDENSIDLLENLGIGTYKIPSGEITNLPFLRKIGGLGKKIILSTGMANLEEIKDALRVLTRTGTSWEKISVLHCNTEYPTPMKDVNLRAMKTIAEIFPRVKVGYSDHTLGIEIAIAAVVSGATIIEKHFTLDKKMEGPDHKVSLEPKEFKQMVKAIRNVETALGNGTKIPSPSEIKNRDIVRKSIVAKKKIQKGELFSEDNLMTKRAGKGINPMLWDMIIGKRSNKEYQADQLIEFIV